MNNMLEYKGYYGTVKFSDTDNVLYGEVIGIKSLISYEGTSVGELHADFEGAVDDYLELCAEQGIDPEKSYKGSFNVRISPDLHRSLAMFSAAHDQSLNTSVEEAIEFFISSNAK